MLSTTVTAPSPSARPLDLGAGERDDPLLSRVRDLAHLAVAERRRASESIDGALVRQIVDHVRSASSEKLTAAAAALNRSLRREVGEVLAAVDPELAGIWHGYARVLGEAGRRRDLSAVQAVLGTAHGRARRVFEAVAAHAEPVPRTELVEIAGGEVLLSKVLRVLEAADLVRRARAGRTVSVRVGASGQAYLARTDREHRIGAGRSGHDRREVSVATDGARASLTMTTSVGTTVAVPTSPRPRELWAAGAA